MLKKLFERWGRYRVIMDRVDNEPYLERYYVFLRDRERFPFNIFVHKFLKSTKNPTRRRVFWKMCPVGFGQRVV